MRWLRLLSHQSHCQLGSKQCNLNAGTLTRHFKIRIATVDKTITKSTSISFLILSIIDLKAIYLNWMIWCRATDVFLSKIKTKMWELKNCRILNVRHRYFLTIPFDPTKKLSGSPIPFTRGVHLCVKYGTHFLLYNQTTSNETPPYSASCRTQLRP